MQASALHELVGAPEVGDELAYGEAIRVAVVNDRVAQGTGGYAAVGFGFDSSEASKRLRVVCRASLRDLGLGSIRLILSALDLRMIFDRNFLRICERETSRVFARGKERRRARRIKKRKIANARASVSLLRHSGDAWAVRRW